MSDDVANALVLYQEAIDLADEPAEAAARLRKVIEIQRANEGAIVSEDGEVVVELEDTLIGLAEAYQALSDWRRLQAVAEELTELAPHLGYAHVALATAHARLGDAPEEVTAAPGPKRMTITMLREIDSGELGKLFSRGMEDNMDKQAFSKLIPGVLG